MFKLITPMTLSEIYKNAWQLYKICLVPVLLWSFIISIIHIIPYLFGFVGFYYQDVAGGLQYSWWGLLLFVVLLVVEAYFLAVLFYTIYLKATEPKLDRGLPFNNAKQVLIPLYFALVLYFLAVTFGLLLLLIPGLFIAILFSMVIPFIVLEKQSTFHAFDSSARLVWGAWWQTFFALVVPYIIIYFIRNFARITPWGGEWLQLTDAIIITFVMPYFYTVIYVQFQNLKTIKSLPAPISERSRTEAIKEIDKSETL